MGLCQCHTKEKQEISSLLSLNISSLVNNLEKVSYTKSEMFLIDQSIDLLKKLKNEQVIDNYRASVESFVNVKTDINIFSSGGRISFDFNLLIFSDEDKDILGLIYSILQMEKTLTKLELLGYPKLVIFKLNFRDIVNVSEFLQKFWKYVLNAIESLNKSNKKDLLENHIFSYFISDKQGVEIQISCRDFNFRMEKLSIITSDQPNSSRDFVVNEYYHESHSQPYPPKIKLREFYFWIINSQEYRNVIVDLRVTSVNLPLRCLNKSLFSVEYNEFFRNGMYEFYTRNEILSCFNNETDIITECSSRVLLKILVIEHCLDVIQSIFKYPKLQVIDLTFCTGSYLTCDRHVKSIIIVLGTLIDNFLPNIKEVNIEIIFKSKKEIREFLTLSKNLIDILASRSFRFVLRTSFRNGKYLKEDYFRKESLQETLLCCYYSKTSLLHKLKKNVLQIVSTFLIKERDGKIKHKLWSEIELFNLGSWYSG